MKNIGSCGANENKHKKVKKMSEHQMKVRKILAVLGFDDYFVSLTVYKQF